MVDGEGAPARELPVRRVPDAAQTWLRIVEVHDRITRQVDSALHRRHGLSLTGFEALRLIAEAPGERTTMGQVADALGLSRAGVTSTVSRLVAEGLVVRERDAGDRRLMHARLTPAGRERVAAAAPTHDGMVAALLALLGADAGVVTDALTRVSAAARTRSGRAGARRTGPGSAGSGDTSSP